MESYLDGNEQAKYLRVITICFHWFFFPEVMVWMGVSIPRSQISLRCCQAFPTTQPRCSLESCANGKKTMHSQNSSVVQCINFCAASMCLSISFFPCTRLMLLLIVRTKFSDFNLTIRVIIAKISTRNEEILLNYTINTS